MKKSSIFLSLICLCFLGVISCVKDDSVQADGTVSFKAVYADTASKVVLDGLTPKWTPTDRISVFDGVNNEFSNTLPSYQHRQYSMASLWVWRRLTLLQVHFPWT